MQSGCGSDDDRWSRDLRGKGLLGGWGWAIPKSSPNPDAAWAFIEWVESFPIAKERALLGGAPARADVFVDPEVLAKYPHYSEVKQVGEAIEFPIMTRSPQVVEVLGRAISESVAGTKEPKQALDEAAAELQNPGRSITYTDPGSCPPSAEGRST